MSDASTGSFDLSVLQKFLHPVLLRAPHSGQVDPVPGHIPQPAYLRRWHETRADHLPLRDLAQPDAVELVCLGPARQVLHIPGVDQPGLKPVRLQHVEHRFPVIAGGLHHDPRHPQAAQPVRHRQQRPGHRRIGIHLLQPPARPVLVRHPHTARHFGLADIQRRDPRDDLLSFLRLLQHPTPLTLPDGQQPAARRNHKERQNLIRVLEATLKLPMHGSQRPARRRPPATIGFRRRRAATHRFSARNGRPRRDIRS
jgi:hypothetical protein